LLHVTDPGSRRTATTQVALIETAERLFAERGIEAVSLRDVSAAAGQRNHSAAQYHFGDRAGLVAAVYEHRMGLVNERRHAMLAALPDEVIRAGGADPSTAAICAVMETVVVPLSDVVAETDGWYGRFLARARWDTFASAVVAELAVLSSYRQARALLSEQIRDQPPAVRHGRLEQVETLFIGTIAGWEWQRRRDLPHLPLPDFQAELVSTATAVMTAPVLAARH
jgi:AcrR family transcriptional regulator